MAGRPLTTAKGRVVVERLVVGPLDTNAYVVWDDSSSDAVIIDPGDEPDRIERLVRRKGLKVGYIINTHGHFDHVGGDGALKEVLGAKLAIHSKDVEALEKAGWQAGLFGYSSPHAPSPDIVLEDASAIRFGGHKMEVLHTPGHTRGGVCLYIKDSALLFTGDTLFAGGIGRTDLPGGSSGALIKSIKGKILTLPDETRVLPGHGPETTVKEEKESNPFIHES